MAHVCGTVLVTFCCDKISWPKATCKRGIYFGLTVLEKESIRSEEGWQQGAGGGSSEITSSTEDTKQGGPLEPGRPVRSEPPPVMDLFSKATPPKGFITFPKEHHQLRTRCSNACTYRGYFSFKPPPPPPPRHGWHPGLDIWERGSHLRTCILPTSRSAQIQESPLCRCWDLLLLLFCITMMDQILSNHKKKFALHS